MTSDERKEIREQLELIREQLHIQLHALAELEAKAHATRLNPSLLLDAIGRIGQAFIALRQFDDCLFVSLPDA